MGALEFFDLAQQRANHSASSCKARTRGGQVELAGVAQLSGRAAGGRRGDRVVIPASSSSPTGRIAARGPGVDHSRTRKAQPSLSPGRGSFPRR